MKLSQCPNKYALVKVLSWCFKLCKAKLKLKQVWNMNEWIWMNECCRIRIKIIDVFSLFLWLLKNMTHWLQSFRDHNQEMHLILIAVLWMVIVTITFMRKHYFYVIFFLCSAPLPSAVAINISQLFAERDAFWSFFFFSRWSRFCSHTKFRHCNQSIPLLQLPGSTTRFDFLYFRTFISSLASIRGRYSDR